MLKSKDNIFLIFIRICISFINASEVNCCYYQIGQNSSDSHGRQYANEGILLSSNPYISMFSSLHLFSQVFRSSSFFDFRRHFSAPTDLFVGGFGPA